MDKNEIQSILNLRSNDSIGKELADRQLEVILKAFQYLSSPTNNIMYIADEVGLGKTYIAAGIAMLLRHYSKDINEQRDVIIVPKKNLQVKWRKELNNFIQNNYLPNNDIIKIQFQGNNPKDRLVPINDAISIFRMSSFSALASPRNSKKELRDYLIDQMFSNDKFAIDTLTQAWEAGYFNNGSETFLRKIVAYLLNALSSKINCLIVDEAHNYKYGLGIEEDEASLRNEMTARFLGAVYDTKVFNEFPGLKKSVKFPLAEKIVCLSATPKDRSLIEIKNQFNCFINQHILSDTKSNTDIKSKLKNFLIRGNLEYRIDNELVSRNQCRFEHREGNINKEEAAKPLIVEEGIESIFWQLLQYKSIKHLNAKNNASFEIGMLAGFECYQLNAEKQKVIRTNNETENNGIADKEYDLLKSRILTESQDYNIVKQLVDSYRDSFENLPPHPKQSKLENEIIKQLSRQEKSLIFVRRVASAYELAKRLLSRYEKDIVVGKQLHLKGKYSRYNTPKLNSLLNEYNSKNTLEHRRELFKNLLSKFEINNFIFQKGTTINESEKQRWLEMAYQYNSEFEEAANNFIRFKKKNISQELKDITIKALDQSYNTFISELDEDKQADDNDIEDSDEEIDSGYFFTNYFKKGNSGFRYRSKMYRENWFEINILLLNRQFPFISYDGNLLESKIDQSGFVEIKKKHQAFQKRQKAIYSFLEENSKKEITTNKPENVLSEQLIESTFLTRLLIEYCSGEMNIWFEKRIRNSRVTHESVIKDLLVLNAILKGIFRNGSGLLPGFVADSTEEDFSVSMLDLIKDEDSPFHFLLNEIKTIISDFDLIVSNNFEDKDENKITSYLKNLSPVVGNTGQDKRDRGMLAAQFRMPGFPYVLVTTDIFREGEDLHCYCQNIYHYGIAWNPSDMEQRTGRIDRINSLSYRKLNESNKLLFDNMVQVFYPYLTQSVEVTQVVQLLRSMNSFIETFNDIEVENKYKSSVSLNTQISKSDIPPQIRNRLKSLYDVSDFQT